MHKQRSWLKFFSVSLGRWGPTEFLPCLPLSFCKMYQSRLPLRSWADVIPRGDSSWEVGLLEGGVRDCMLELIVKCLIGFWFGWGPHSGCTLGPTLHGGHVVLRTGSESSTYRASAVHIPGLNRNSESFAFNHSHYIQLCACPCISNSHPKINETNSHPRNKVIKTSNTS